jgi:hypothetical protein
MAAQKITLVSIGTLRGIRKLASGQIPHRLIEERRHRLTGLLRNAGVDRIEFRLEIGVAAVQRQAMGLRILIGAVLFHAVDLDRGEAGLRGLPFCGDRRRRDTASNYRRDRRGTDFLDRHEAPVDRCATV